MVARPRPTLPRWAPGLVLLAGAAFWLWLALAVHTLPVVGGELDSYMERAEALLRGQLPEDRLHPLGLPLVLAALGLFGLDAFLAGRLCSIGCALLLVVCAYRLVRLWAGRAVATLAALAAGASPYVLTGAVQACTDVPSAAFLALALLCWTRSATEVRAPIARLALGGFALGFAASLRMPALTLLPACLPMLLGVPWRERLARSGWSTLGLGLGLAPHLVTLWLSGGSLLQNSSQIVWKYRYRDDDAGFLAYLNQPVPVPWSEQLDWYRLGLAEWLDYLWRGLGEPWSPVGSPWIATALSLGCVLAMLLPLFARRRAPGVLAIAGLVYSIALCIFTVPLQRLTIPMVLPTVVLSTLAWLRLPLRLRALPLVLAALAAGLALARVPRTLDRFERLHARAEMAAARQLVAEHGEWITIALPAVGVDRSVHCVFATYSPGAAVPGAPATRWDQLLANPAARAAGFVVVGRATWPDVYADMAGAPPPPGYERLRADDVLVFARTGDRPWYETATARVEGRDIHLVLRLAATVDRTKLAAAGFLVRDGARGEWRPMLLEATADGTFAAVIAAGPDSLERHCTFVPAMMLWDGSKHTGSAIEVTVPAGTGR